jgi:hypothetical protein
LQIVIKLTKDVGHDPCCLTSPKPELIGADGLDGCNAFGNAGKNCEKCGHGWKLHLHIKILYTETITTTMDDSVQKGLDGTLSLAAIKEAQIKALERTRREYEAELEQIQQTAARFRVYLKANAIASWDDSTLRYMDLLIREEEQKQKVEANQNRLEMMRKEKQRYKGFVRLMDPEETPDSKYPVLDEDGVNRVIQDLYRLRHFGGQLRDVSKIAVEAYDLPASERRYRIRGNGYGTRPRANPKANVAETPLHMPRRPATHRPIKSMLDIDEDDVMPSGDKAALGSPSAPSTSEPSLMERLLRDTIKGRNIGSEAGLASGKKPSESTAGVDLAGGTIHGPRLDAQDGIAVPPPPYATMNIGPSGEAAAPTNKVSRPRGLWKRVSRLFKKP